MFVFFAAHSRLAQDYKLSLTVKIITRPVCGAVMWEMQETSLDIQAIRNPEPAGGGRPHRPIQRVYLKQTGRKKPSFLGPAWARDGEA